MAQIIEKIVSNTHSAQQRASIKRARCGLLFGSTAEHQLVCPRCVEHVQLRRQINRFAVWCRPRELHSTRAKGQNNETTHVETTDLLHDVSGHQEQLHLSEVHSETLPNANAKRYKFGAKRLQSKKPNEKVLMVFPWQHCKRAIKGGYLACHAGRQKTIRIELFWTLPLTTHLHTNTAQHTRTAHKQEMTSLPNTNSHQ